MGCPGCGHWTRDPICQDCRTTEANLAEHNPEAESPQKPEDAPGSTIGSTGDTGAQKRGEVTLAATGGPVASVSRRRGPTLCPEDLTAEQWTQVRKWRDKKHPEFDDWILKREWERHSAFFGGLGKMRPNWVRSFYSWLLKMADFQKTVPQPPCSQSPTFVSSGKPPPEMTDEEKTELHKQHLRDKAKAGFKVPHVPTNAVDDVPF